MNIQKIKDKIRFHDTASQIHLSREEIAEITGATEHQVNSWMDGITLAKAVLKGEKFIKTDKFRSPRKQSILALENGIIQIAKNVQHDGRSLDALNLLTKTEFFNGWYNDIADTVENGLETEILPILMIALENEQPSITLHIKGRSGYLGYHECQITSDSLKASYEAIKSELYERYLQITHAAQNADLEDDQLFKLDCKRRFASASQMLGLTNKQIAVLSKLRAADDNETQNGLSTVIGWMSNKSELMPPEIILHSFQREVQKWANFVLFLSETDVSRKLDAKSAYPMSVFKDDHFDKYSLEHLYKTACDNKESILNNYY